MPSPGYGENGSVIGPQNLPTGSVASGVWSLGEVAEAQRDGTWPNPITGSYEFIASLFVTGTNTANYLFLNIPQTYRFLDVRMMKAENSNAQRWGMGKNQTSYNNNEAYMGTDGNGSRYFGNEAANYGQYVYMAGHKASYASSMGTVMMGNYTVSNRYLPMAVIGGTMNGNSGELTMSTSGYSNTVQAATTSLYVVIQEGTNIPQGSTIGLFGIKDAN